MSKNNTTASSLAHLECPGDVTRNRLALWHPGNGKQAAIILDIHSHNTVGALNIHFYGEHVDSSGLG